MGSSKKVSLTQALLHELFMYCDGHLHWAVSRGRVKKGQKAGAVSGPGYIMVQLKGTMHYAHRLIWIYHNGDIPEGLTIDHINRDKVDNKIENLRLCTKAENNQNNDRKGYCWNKQKKKWQARVHLDGKQIHIGFFDKPEDARAAYLEAKPKYHKMVS